MVLPVPAGTDDEDEIGVAGDGARGVGLGQGHVDVAAVDGGGIVGAVVFEAAVGPLDERPLLVEDRLGGQRTVDDRLGDRSTVASQECAGRDRLGDVDATLGGDTAGEFVCPPHDGVGVFGGLGRAPRGDLTDELGRSPRRLLLADRLDGPVRDRVVEVVVDRSPIQDLFDRVLDHPTRFHAERSGLLAPAVVQARGVDRLRLAGAAVDGGFPVDQPALLWCGFAAHRVDEAVELLLDTSTHLGGADRELGEERLGHVADLGDAVLRRVPHHTETLRQLGSQTSVVERRQGALVALDEAGVEGEPTTVGRLHTVGDHEVGVELRVERPAGVLAEHRRDDPLGVDDGDLAADPVAGVGVTFDPSGERSDRGVVGVEHLASDVVVAEGEQDRHRLGCRGGDVEAADRVVVVAASEMSVRALRVHAGDEGEEGVVVDLARQAEHRCAVAEPRAAGLAGLQVVVRELLDVVGAGVASLEGGDPHGHGVSHSARVLPG